MEKAESLSHPVRKSETVKEMTDIFRGKGYGYEDRDGMLCIYAPAVSSGQCAWCGYNPSATDWANAW